MGQIKNIKLHIVTDIKMENNGDNVTVKKEKIPVHWFCQFVNTVPLLTLGGISTLYFIGCPRSSHKKRTVSGLLAAANFLGVWATWRPNDHRHTDCPFYPPEEPYYHLGDPKRGY